MHLFAGSYYSRRTTDVGRYRPWFVFVICLCALGIVACSSEDEQSLYPALGDAPGIFRHISNEELEDGTLTSDDLIALGKELFTTSFNSLDGAGNSKTRLFEVQTGLSRMNAGFNRISGPDANACSGCHNMPAVGGGGDNVANVFVLAHRFPNVNFDRGAGDLFETLTLDTVGNERGTISMFGSGLIELLAREMTYDLHEIREKAREDARMTQQPVTVAAITKGVSFGRLTVWPDGLVDASKIEGVDEDLIIKPFSQKGVVISLREFTLNALEIHHGLQAEERVGSNIDADLDGVSNELTIADVTALTLFQASLPAPTRQKPKSDLVRTYVDRGEIIFDRIGCAVCHKLFLELNNPIYSEPNPFNPPGTLDGNLVLDGYDINLIARMDPRVVKPTGKGTYLVYAYTDLKRHDMGPVLANEALKQEFVEPPVWLTRKLWGIASEPPFLHHGRATLFGHVIDAHRGEADLSRKNYEGLSSDDKDALIEFLKGFRTPLDN